MTTDIGILLYDGFDELDAVGPCEEFQTAGAFGADLSVGLVKLHERPQVTASHGLRVQPDGQVDPDADRPDLLVVPGGGWNTRSEAGAWAEAERGVVPDALATLHEAGVTVASVCTGGMLVARAGLTDGRPAVTHASAVDDLRESGADVVDARVVDDGDVLTAGGVTSGLDLALYLVERLADVAVAEQVATEIEYERRFDVYVASD